MGKTGISVRMSEKDADDVVHSFNSDRKYLINLVLAYVPEETRQDPQAMTYTELKRHGYVIHGVAQKMLKPKKIAIGLEGKIPTEQLKLFR